MKRHLYELDYRVGYYAYHIQHVPFMPRVLAEKTAKAMRKDEQRRYGRLVERFATSKTTLITGDATPHGYTDWWSYIDSKRREQS